MVGYMRIAFLWGLFLFAVGALVADRYGLPHKVTDITDRGFSQVEAWIAGGELPQTDFYAAASEPVIFTDTALSLTATSHSDKTATREAPVPAAALMPKAPVEIADNSGLSLNENGLEIIKMSRGLTLSSVERHGRWQIGYGHTATAAPDMSITVPEAEQLLIADLQNSADGVQELVTVPLNENEYSALVSFIDSIGIENFSGTEVYHHLQSGDREAAAEAMEGHTLARVNGQMTPMSSLVERRARESQLFLSEG